MAYVNYEVTQFQSKSLPQDLRAAGAPGWLLTPQRLRQQVRVHFGNEVAESSVTQSRVTAPIPVISVPLVVMSAQLSARIGRSPV
jgi:hypothetical protein